MQLNEQTIGFQPRRYKFGDQYRCFIPKDHANNLHVKACLLSYNWHVRLLFKTKKKKKRMQ